MPIKTIFLSLIILFNSWFSLHPQLDLVRIQNLKDGDYLQGNVQISGTVTGTGLKSVEVSFRYQDTESSGWFTIKTLQQMVVDDTIAVWDTSTIADGTYQLRVLAIYEDGRQQETVVKDLKVRNYTPFDPGEMEHVLITQTLMNISDIEETPEPIITKLAPTPMPANEMTITQSQFLLTLIQGAILGALFLIVVVLFVIIRRRKLG